MFSLSACSKDEFSTDGELRVSFVNHPSDLRVFIYAMENSEIPIYELTSDHEGKIKMTINVGDYILKPHSASIFYSTIGFQVRQDKTTTVAFNDRNIGKQS